MVVREFHEAQRRNEDLAVAVAAIRALTAVIRQSTTTTLMGLSDELKAAATALQRCRAAEEERFASSGSQRA